MLRHYLDHQIEVVTRRLRYDLDKAERRLHILEGLKIAIDNIDEVIKIIRASKTIPEAREALMERFSLTEVQSQEIVQMPLGKLSGLERQIKDYKKMSESIGVGENDIERYCERT